MTQDSASSFALALQAAREAWPDLAVPPETFEAFLKARALDLDRATSSIIQDLYLACACAAQLPGALAAFRTKFAPIIAAAARKFDESPAFIDEVGQRLNETLFVGQPDSPPKISRYAGDGPLGGFVGTSVRRIAMRLISAGAKFQGEEALIQQFSEVSDHEMALIKMRYRETFNNALSVALRQVSRRDRLILRLNVVERVSTAKIATMYKVSQPTVSRWIQRAAEGIFAAVKELVCDELDLDTRDLHSLLALVRSQIEFTLSQTAGDTNISNAK